MMEPEDMAAAVWAVGQLCHLVGWGMTWVVALALAVALLLRRAPLGQPQSRNVDRRLL
jgi:hypothetical protein